jgi:nucleotide-binding universal stress UspA family protein
VVAIVSNPEYEALAPALSARAESQAADKIALLQERAVGQAVATRFLVRRGPEPYLTTVDAAKDIGADLIVTRRRGERGFLARLLVGEMVSKVAAHSPCDHLLVPREGRLWSRRILVGVDPAAPDPDLVDRAISLALAWALPLTLASVAEPALHAQAQTALDQATARAVARGVTADSTLQSGRPHQRLIEIAERGGADLIVVGRHGADDLARAWIGGVTQKVIALAPCPVLLCIPSNTTPSSP